MAAVTVPYIAVNIYNYPWPVITVANNFMGLIFSKVGCRDLGMCFGDEPSP